MNLDELGFEKFEAEDLLLEASFRNYCLGINDPDVAFWQEWVAAHPARLPVVQQARDMYFMLNGNITAGQFQEDVKTFHAKLQQHAGSLPPKKATPVKRMLLYAAAVAASVVLFIWLFRQSSEKPKSVQYAAIHATKAGERKQLQLPDGSKVSLNAGSSLKLAGDFSSSTREMELEGEAFFEVTHDAGHPFIIHTAAMDIKVLGTVFNVKAYADDPLTETVLLKGSVEVSLHNAAHQKIILHPGEKIAMAHSSNPNQAGKTGSYNIEQVDHHPANDTQPAIPWMQNRLDFNNRPFNEIAKTLERWYNVKVIFEDSAIAGYTYTGVFEKKTVEQVLKALQLSRPFNYTIDNNKVIYIKK